MTHQGRVRHTFSKAERLSGKKNIEELFKHGSSFYFKPILLKYLDKADEPKTHRLLVSVPKKKLKRAVDRNLVKRRIRESYRLNKHILTGESPFYHMAIVYLDEVILSYSEIEEKLIKLLNRLQNLKSKDQ